MRTFWFGVASSADQVSVERVRMPKPVELEIADLIAYASRRVQLEPSETMERFSSFLKRAGAKVRPLHPATEELVRKEFGE